MICGYPDACTLILECPMNPKTIYRLHIPKNAIFIFARDMYHAGDKYLGTNHLRIFAYWASDGTDPNTFSINNEKIFHRKDRGQFKILDYRPKETCVGSTERLNGWFSKR